MLRKRKSSQKLPGETPTAQALKSILILPFFDQGHAAMKAREDEFKIRWHNASQEDKLSLSSQTGETVLHIMSTFGYLDLVKTTLAECPELFTLRAQALGEYPIHKAIFSGKLDIVEYFLEYDDETMNQVDYHKSTPLHYAALSGHFDILKACIRKALERQIPLDAKDFQGKSPIDLAKNDEIKQILIDAVEADIQNTNEASESQAL